MQNECPDIGLQTPYKRNPALDKFAEVLQAQKTKEPTLRWQVSMDRWKGMHYTYSLCHSLFPTGFSRREVFNSNGMWNTHSYKECRIQESMRYLA